MCSAMLYFSVNFLDRSPGFASVMSMQNHLHDSIDFHFQPCTHIANRKDFLFDFISGVVSYQVNTTINWYTCNQVVNGGKAITR